MSERGDNAVDNVKHDSDVSQSTVNTCWQTETVSNINPLESIGDELLLNRERPTIPKRR